MDDLFIRSYEVAVSPNTPMGWGFIDVEKRICLGNCEVMEERMATGITESKYYSSLEQLIEDEVGETITHETIHLVLWDKEGFNTSKKFDNIPEWMIFSPYFGNYNFKKDDE